MRPPKKTSFSHFLLLHLLFLCFRLRFCIGRNIITSISFVTDPSTLSSDNNFFELGFFSPVNTTSRYVGIWPNQGSDRTVVWVANRDNPLSDSSGVFTISKDGNLVVLDGKSSILWSSNLLKPAINSTALLLDSGNLVLRDSASGMILWESFKNPSDSFLPGMKFVTNTITILSLGFSSHASPPHRAQIADDSILLHLDSSRRESLYSSPPVPLQLMEPQTESHRDEDGDAARDDDYDDREVEEFRILGHSMCLKRRRDGESSSSSGSTKRISCDFDIEARRSAVRSWGNQTLRVADPNLFGIMEKEKQRQFKGIELIASENYVCRAVMEALGSHLTNKYSEGMPGARYYGGNQYIDEIETLCRERALAAFGLDSDSWGVNVQPYSCTSANFAVYTGLLLPGDRIMGLDTPSGGNTSHGYCTPNGRKVSGASIFFESLPYKVNPQTGYIDYDKLEERALDFRPKILICGGSSYPRELDYARFRQIADKCGAVLMCDMAQISGLVAAKECVSPFGYCDVVTSTTHKSLRGPRGGIIFYRKGSKPRKRAMLLYQGNETDHYDFEEKINFAVFPSLQGGPHNNHIAALAVALKQVATPEYKAYMQQVKKNAQALASALLRKKYRLVTGGTDNHMLLWDLRSLGLTGKNYEKVCEICHITLNKITIFGDNGIIIPGGVRIGTPAMTSRGCLESDFETIADFLHTAAQIAISVQREHGKLPKSYLKGLQSNNEVVELRNRVESFSAQFAMPGFET